VPNMENCNMVMIETFFLLKAIKQPIPVAARYKASVCGSSLDGIAGSNPSVGMAVYCECCVLSEVCATSRILVQGCPTECDVL